MYYTKCMNLEEQAASLSHQEIIGLLVTNQLFEAEKTSHQKLQGEYQELKEQFTLTQQQLEWFKKQYFGQKSEKRIFEPHPEQLSFGDMLKERELLPKPSETIKSYQRRTSKKSIEEQVTEEGLRFDSSVPVKTIDVEDPEIEGLEEGKDYKIIAEKVTHRLAQRPASYVVLKYIRKVVKLNGRTEPSCRAAPSSVLEKSFADVSLLVGLLVDKFVYHLPLYRQHQRLRAAGIELSRQTLTNYTKRTISLLEPIYYSQLSSILQSEVILMDETPVKAGRKEKGKLHQGYFWPVYGDQNEIAFPYSPSRGTKVVKEVLGEYCKTLMSDGYEAYERYVKEESDVTHALCWAHTRRKFVEAEEVCPELVCESLNYIRRLYENEEYIREHNLIDTEKIAYRAEYSRPIVYQFFEWLKEVMNKRVFLPTDLFLQAVSYTLKRRAGLEVFLYDAHVPIDTNLLERTLRPIPMGRKNWLFCWTELGAEQVGKVQSLIQTCRLHNIDPYTYLVDVLQRIDTHPALHVDLLTPRLWKDNFKANPLRSDLG